VRIRPTTWAMLWYPLACAALAAGFGAWLWTQCADARRPVACRRDIVPGMGMFFLVIFAIGMVVLAIIWLIGRMIGRSSPDSGSEWSEGPSDDSADRTDASTEAEPLIESGSDSDPARRG
jgi:hypothetical protein